MTSFCELLKVIMYEYIEFPEELEITEENGENSVLIKIKTCKSDTAKIIGKKGRNINSLRTLFKSVAAKRKQILNIYVIN